MNKLFTLTAVLAVVLPFGFASCSDDDPDPTDKPTVKLLPIKIEITDEDGAYATYELTYNDKNQLIKSFDTESPEEGNITYDYNDKGQLTKVSFEMDRSYSHICEYDEEAGKVSIITGDSREDATFKISNAGFPSYRTSSEYTRVYETTYEYDKFNNLVLTKETVNQDEEDRCRRTYTELYSPFANLNLPAFYFMEDDSYGIQTTGLHMSKVVSYVSKNSSEIETYTVEKQQDNYPTVIKEVVIYTHDGEEDSITEYTHTFTYKEIQ